MAGARGAWEVDPSKSRARGGTNYLRNLMPSCIPCNRAKGEQSSRRYKETILLETIAKHPHRFPELFRRKTKRKPKPSFGLKVADANRVLSMHGVTGAYVGSVKPGSAAAKAGLQEGDIIIEVNGIPILTAADFETMFKIFKKGSLILLVRRGVSTLRVAAVL